MGNPHAVQVVADVDAAPVTSQGPQIEHHPRFPRGVNAGYMQVRDRANIRLRVWERGAGETLACGTGACAAVAAGIMRGLLDPVVRVRDAGRHFDDRLARARRARDDDRPGDNRIRRRNRDAPGLTSAGTGRVMPDTERTNTCSTKTTTTGNQGWMPRPSPST